MIAVPRKVEFPYTTNSDSTSPLGSLVTAAFTELALAI
jgi:hypothetical protein